MRSGDENDRDDEIALLDLTRPGWLQRVCGDITKASVAKQIAIGGVSGWCAGYMFGKVGRAAAAAVGGGLLLLQIASHQGIIKVNWGRLEQQVDRAKRTLRKDVDKMGPALTQEVKIAVPDVASFSLAHDYPRLVPRENKSYPSSVPSLGNVVTLNMCVLSYADPSGMTEAVTQLAGSQVVEFVKANMFLAGGFGGGFFLGLAS